MSSNCKADNIQYSDAENHALEAAYQQTGLKKMLEEYGKKLDRMYVPEYLNKNGGVFLVAYRLIHDQQLSYKWTFQ